MVYDMNTEKDINETYLNKKPKKLTIIYLKNKLWKGKTITKTHILLAQDHKILKRINYRTAEFMFNKSMLITVY